ncbi:hypothetical protein [Bacillus sp. FJAT-45066]|uniref:hypothetical protein n=1 Tax=Bacillus sp. FJAT-45066 TaxID=2011010 RepID=UPI000BB68ACC|nr:hypothetical protein [Bacillus sp. FJAT-45066]
MLIVQIGVILLAIIIGYIQVKKEYKNFTAFEKEQLKIELKNPIFALFHMLDYIGYVIFFVGIVFQIYDLYYFAFLLIGLGWIIDGADLMRVNNKKGLIVVSIGAIVFLTTSLLGVKALFGFDFLQL